MAKALDAENNAKLVENLQNDLHLKQLQINRLLGITQAINNNVSAHGLYEMYRSFLGWELGVHKMALYVREEDGRWDCTASIDILPELLHLDIGDLLPSFDRLKSLDGFEHPLIREFNIVIPVKHKEAPIAYVFIGGFGEDEDVYNKIQFITTITNIIAVAIENKRLFKRQLEQQRLRKEMELAAEVQQMLIPKRLPGNDRYEFGSIYKPQLSVGGDYFDFIEFADGKIVFCIGDFTGKGLAAALLMANFQANFHTLINQRLGLDVFIRAMNKSVNRITDGDKFITFFIAEYDFNTGRLTYVNAGHNPPILVGHQQKQLLNKGCIMLGSYPEIHEIEIGYCDIEGSEAMILSYTDGLVEIRDENGQYFNEEALVDFVALNYKCPAGEFNNKLMAYIDRFRGNENIPDDFTVLTCKVHRN
ncbi:MAG: PP2C family protein-serine/threonine phosphatase [Saprospiraceae bacterium]|jgi:sigma-B regulation protein RsbU (phosphoserine phosphatase)